MHIRSDRCGTGTIKVLGFVCSPVAGAGGHSLVILFLWYHAPDPAAWMIGIAPVPWDDVQNPAQESEFDLFGEYCCKSFNPVKMIAVPCHNPVHPQ